jgi:rhodanese-related sulfurtransferase
MPSLISRTLRQLAALLALAVLPALVSGAIQLQWRPAAAEPDSGEVTVAGAKTWGDTVLWIDARPRSRHEAGHIDGALRLSPEEWGRLVAPFLKEWDPNRPIIVYDDGDDPAAESVADRLRTELGLDNVHVLKGGIRAWQAE